MIWLSSLQNICTRHYHIHHIRVANMLWHRQHCLDGYKFIRFVKLAHSAFTHHLTFGSFRTWRPLPGVCVCVCIICHHCFISVAQTLSLLFIVIRIWLFGKSWNGNVETLSATCQEKKWMRLQRHKIEKEHKSKWYRYTAIIDHMYQLHLNIYVVLCWSGTRFDFVSGHNIAVRMFYESMWMAVSGLINNFDLNIWNWLLRSKRCIDSRFFHISHSTFERIQFQYILYLENRAWEEGWVFMCGRTKIFQFLLAGQTKMKWTLEFNWKLVTSSGGVEHRVLFVDEKIETPAWCVNASSNKFIFELNFVLHISTCEYRFVYHSFRPHMCIL